MALLSPSAPTKICICASAQDASWRKELETLLSPLEQGKLISIQRSSPGNPADVEMDEADLVLLLVSRSYLAHCQTQWRRAIHLLEQGRARVVPILIDTSDWRETPLGMLSPLPKGGKPIKMSRSPEQAWNSIRRELRRLLRPPPDLPRGSRVALLYSSSDRNYARSLLTHLRPLERSGLLSLWHPELIVAGDEIRRVMLEIERADLAVVLVSPSLLNDDELMALIQHAVELKRPRLLSLEVRPLAWNPLPFEGQLVFDRSDPEASFAGIAVAIRDLVVREGALHELGRLACLKDSPVLFAHSVADVCIALGEDPLPADIKLVPLLQQRIRRADWADARGVRALLRSCEIPGPIAPLALELRMAAPDLSAEVSMALEHLREPNQHDAGRLAADVLLLRRIAEMQPYMRIASTGEVAIPSELPVLLLRALQGALSLEDTGRDVTSMAQVETLLFSRWQQFVEGRFGTQGGERNQWLAHRLLQFTWDRLNSLSPDERLAELKRLEDAARTAVFPSYRLAALLLAMGQGWASSLWTPASPALEDFLADLATKSLDYPHFAGVWDRLVAIHEAALHALMLIRPKRFLKLPPLVRHKWLARIPQFHEPDTAALLLRSAAEHAGELSEDERRLLQARCVVALETAVPDLTEAARYAQIQLLGLGALDLLPSLQDYFTTCLADPAAVELFSHYLAALSRAGQPAALTSEFDRVLRQVASMGLSSTPFVLAIARVLNTSQSTLAGPALQALRSHMGRHGLANDETLQRLVRRFGVE